MKAPSGTSTPCGGSARGLVSATRLLVLIEELFNLLIHGLRSKFVDEGEAFLDAADDDPLLDCVVDHRRNRQQVEDNCERSQLFEPPLLERDSSQLRLFEVARVVDRRLQVRALRDGLQQLNFEFELFVAEILDGRNDVLVDCQPHLIGDRSAPLLGHRSQVLKLLIFRLQRKEKHYHFESPIGINPVPRGPRNLR
jgi:hypothetical protein